jgi:hypothetical protein
VGAISGEVTIRPDKRLAAVLRPEAAVIKLASIPDNLIEELGNPNGVRRWARSTALEGAARRVGDVAHVVLRVEVDAVPAGREANVGHDALLAGPGGHGGRLARAGVEGVEAGEGQLPEPGRLSLRAVERVAHNHAEAGAEGGDLLVLCLGLMIWDELLREEQHIR